MTTQQLLTTQDAAATAQATAKRAHRAAKRREFFSHPVASIGALLLALLWLIPVYWMVNSAFQSESELLSWPPHLVPQQFTWDNFASAFSNPNFFPALGASLTAGALTVIFASGAALLASFALSRFRFRGRTMMIIAIAS